MSIDPLARTQLGKSNLALSRMGFGAGALGDPWAAIPESQAQSSLQVAYAAGIRYFDTAPWYGNTLSEHRVGHFLRQRVERDWILSTKVGRVYMRDALASQGHAFYERWQGGLKFRLRFDYTVAGIMRSYEDSLMRMGVSACDSLVIHDLDLRHQKNEAGISEGFKQLSDDGGFAALQDLKKSGEISVIGAGINHLGMIPRFVAHFDIDYFLLAMPYTLIDQSALDIELPLCQEKQIGVVIGAVFGSGILATGVTSNAKYGYQNAEPEVVERVKKMELICREYDVALPAAALQFPLFHPAVCSVIPGCNSVEQVERNMAHLRSEIPIEFWAELKRAALIRDDAPVPEA